MKHKTVTSIEITDSYIKIVHATTGTRNPSVIACDVKEITEKSDTEISKALLQMISGIKIKTENCVAVIPRRFAILRHINLPSHSQVEIEKMLNLQVGRQVPYPKEDIVIDYIVLHKEPTGYSKVLVIAVHKDVINRYLKIFGDAGLLLHKLTLSSDGLFHWFLHYGIKARLKPTDPMVLINIDFCSTEICFFYQEKLLFTRSIHFGSKDLSKDNIAAFTEQIDLTIRTYINEKIGPNISGILLVSSIAEVSLLKEKLMTDYMAKVEVADPMENVRQKRNLALPAALSEDGVSLAVSLGLVLMKSGKTINLLPEEVTDTRRIKLKRLQWVQFLTLFIITFLLAVGVWGIHIYKGSRYLKELQFQIDKTKSAVKKIKEKQRRFNFIKKRLGSGISAVDIIYELYNLTPQDISYSLLYIKEDNSLSLKGVAQESSSVNALQSGLVKSPLFEDVTLQYVTKRRVFKGELTDFKIDCRVLR